MGRQRRGVWIPIARQAISRKSAERGKLHDDLCDLGEDISPNRAWRLARLAGIKAQIGSKKKPGSYAGSPAVVADNTLNREFDVPSRGLHTNRCRAADQGSQFTSYEWQEVLEQHNLAPSMSRRGNCRDNAVVESFFNLLKRERIRRKKYTTREEARRDVFASRRLQAIAYPLPGRALKMPEKGPTDYIEFFYNPQRKQVKAVQVLTESENAASHCIRTRFPMFWFPSKPEPL